MKELGRLEAQLASLRQELAALTLRQNSVADEVGLLPQKIQAARADVSWNFPKPCRTPSLLRPPTWGRGPSARAVPLASCSRGECTAGLMQTWTLGEMLSVPGHCCLESRS